MTPDEENTFYAQPENQVPQGPPIRRRKTTKLSAAIPVRLPEDVLAEIRERAADDDRSVSSWIRRAIDHELHTG
jgi:hypothetical protein